MKRLILLTLTLALALSACSLPTGPHLTCKPWAGIADSAGSGTFGVFHAHPDSVCTPSR